MCTSLKRLEISASLGLCVSSVNRFCVNSAMGTTGNIEGKFFKWRVANSLSFRHSLSETNSKVNMSNECETMGLDRDGVPEAKMR